MLLPNALTPAREQGGGLSMGLAPAVRGAHAGGAIRQDEVAIVELLTLALGSASSGVPGCADGFPFRRRARDVGALLALLQW